MNLKVTFDIIDCHVGEDSTREKLETASYNMRYISNFPVKFKNYSLQQGEAIRIVLLSPNQNSDTKL